MIVRQHVAPTPAGDDRHVEQLGELGQIARGAGTEHAAAGEDHRPLGRGQQLEDRAGLVGVRAWQRRPGDLGGTIRPDDLVEEVLRQRQQHRSRAPAERLVDGPREHGGNLVRRARFRRPLGQPTEAPDLVDLLECLAASERSSDLADEGKHRRGVLAGRVDPDREVRGTYAPGPHARRRAAGELPVGIGHERGAVLMAGCDDPDAGVLDALEQAQEALARHGERKADTRRAERIGDEAAHRPRPGRRRGLSGGFQLGVGTLLRRRGLGGRLGLRLGFRARLADAGSAGLHLGVRTRLHGAGSAARSRSPSAASASSRSGSTAGASTSGGSAGAGSASTGSVSPAPGSPVGEAVSGAGSAARSRSASGGSPDGVVVGSSIAGAWPSRSSAPEASVFVSAVPVGSIIRSVSRDGSFGRRTVSL